MTLTRKTWLVNVQLCCW